MTASANFNPTLPNPPPPDENPPDPWSPSRKVMWIVITCMVGFLWGPLFIDCFARPYKNLILDFYQEWGSAKNYFAGTAVYGHQEISIQRHLQARRSRDPGQVWINYNAHPPTSVLVTLPFAALSYGNAFLVWNVMSMAMLGLTIWMVANEFCIRLSPWSLLPIASLLLVCNPFMQQMTQGQWNLVLLFLITCSWMADRRGKTTWAGVFLGLAAVLKLFPGFLFLYFLVRRKWTALLTGAATGVGLTAITVAVLGIDTYRDYVEWAMPDALTFRDWWTNSSIMGWWWKLFVGASGHTIPIIKSATVAWVGTALCWTAISAVAAWVIWKARTRNEEDHAFAVAIVAMMLVSPITWEHYYMLMLMPAALLWCTIPTEGVWQWVLGFLLLAIWLFPGHVWRVTVPGKGELMGQVAVWWQSLTLVSYQTYALLMFYFVAVLAARGFFTGERHSKGSHLVKVEVPAQQTAL